MQTYEYLVCPELSATCSVRLKDNNKILQCECGRKYFKIDGIPALRGIDAIINKENETLLPEGSKYYDKTFIGMFFLRQYGPLVQIIDSPQHSFNSRLFSRLSENMHGGEFFYQQLINTALPYLRSDSVILDIGCGTGRLTGEFAIRGVRFAIGIDYSPDMVLGATNVVLGEQGKAVEFLVRSSRLQLRKANINGWGIQNCVFAVADAHTLPIRRHEIDLIACINLLHRVRNPKKVIQEMSRVLKQDGILLASNSYDWSEEYTPKELWFDDFLEELSSNSWRMESEIDGVPYTTKMYNRKLSLTLNHIQVFRKLLDM